MWFTSSFIFSYAYNVCSFDCCFWFSLYRGCYVYRRLNVYVWLVFKSLVSIDGRIDSSCRFFWRLLFCLSEVRIRSPCCCNDGANATPDESQNLSPLLVRNPSEDFRHGRRTPSLS